MTSTANGFLSFLSFIFFMKNKATELKAISELSVHQDASLRSGAK
jgi:hypothetical protein